MFVCTNAKHRVEMLEGMSMTAEASDIHERLHHAPAVSTPLNAWATAACILIHM